MQAKYLIIAAGLAVGSPLVATTSSANQAMHPTANATGQMGHATPSSKCGGGCCPGAQNTNQTQHADAQAQKTDQQPQGSNPQPQTSTMQAQDSSMQAQNTKPDSTKRAFFC
jgi:hypothetical protein